MPIQRGLTLKLNGNLQSLWFELPSYCTLACSYCYADGGKPERPKDLLTLDDYTRILQEAKEIGVISPGIPGAGEPFEKRNKNLTMKVLERCVDLGFYTTLFTTGEFITEELADKLIEMPVELMIKCNSLNPDIQNAFVSDPKRNRIITHYGQRRNEVLEMLMRKGFNRPMRYNESERESRLAIVTSIMTNSSGALTNYKEMPDLLRFARRNNLIFDVDSVLERGRGATCGLSTKDKELKECFSLLQRIDKEEFGREIKIGQSYYGTICDRFAHHLYINQYGEIRPCIGAMGVNLGNIKTNTLAEAWERPEMQMIKSRNYKGKCGDECANFSDGECNSCLGRRTENLTNEFLLEKDYVPTIGCWNHRPKQ